MSMNITIATREDLFPLVHGAAVKIVRTAEALANCGCEVTIVTSDRLRYHRFTRGRHEMLDYPSRLVAATRMGPRMKALAMSRMRVRCSASTNGARKSCSMSIAVTDGTAQH